MAFAEEWAVRRHFPKSRFFGINQKSARLTIGLRLYFLRWPTTIEPPEKVEGRPVRISQVVENDRFRVEFDLYPVGMLLSHCQDGMLNHL